VRANPALFTVP